nr:hypothetical protein JVH1_6795 [Rhodococcus sp. JVH1]
MRKLSRKTLSGSYLALRSRSRNRGARRRGVPGVGRCRSSGTALPGAGGSASATCRAARVVRAALAI